MTRINVQNETSRPVLVPARGGLSVVLGPGERSTVCPEGPRAQGRFWSLVSRGRISEQARLRSNPAPFVVMPARTGDYNYAA